MQRWITDPYNRIGEKLTKDQRPILGSSIIASAVMVRKRNQRNSGSFEKAHLQKEWMRQDRKVQGIYIGYRTTWDGNVDWDYEAGSYFIPKKHQELWLVVFHPRRSPVYVRPEDCIWEK